MASDKPAIRVYGIPEQQAEDLKESVKSFITNELRINIVSPEDEVGDCFRANVAVPATRAWMEILRLHPKPVVASLSQALYDKVMANSHLLGNTTYKVVKELWQERTVLERTAVDLLGEENVLLIDVGVCVKIQGKHKVFVTGRPGHMRRYCISTEPFQDLEKCLIYH